jgi:hypothetical protein
MKNAFKKIILFALPVIALFEAGCASAYHEGRDSAVDLKMPDPGKSEVVFVRPSQFAGSGVTFTVHDEAMPIGILPPSSFFTYECQPGHHVFSSSMENMGNNILDDTRRTV